MPADMEYILEQDVSAVQQLAAPAKQVNNATDGMSRPNSSNAASQRTVKMTAAQKHGKQLDAMLVAREQENLKRAGARTAEYNASVKVPCWDALP